MPVIVTKLHPRYIDDQVQMTNWYEAVFARWLADPPVIAAAPMFWNPEQNRFWMFAVAGDGSAVALSPTYRRLRARPKLAGSPYFRPALENVAWSENGPSGAVPAQGVPPEGVPANHAAPVR